MNKTTVPEDQVRFFSGSSNPALAEAIANELGVPLDDTHITRFSNDNLYIQLGETVRYRRVYIVQSLSQPVNDHLMELLMMLDIARSAAATEVHAIIPYYSFARSDKKDALEAAAHEPVLHRRALAVQPGGEDHPVASRRRQRGHPIEPGVGARRRVVA